jgi:hypothetical protein
MPWYLWLGPYSDVVRTAVALLPLAALAACALASFRMASGAAQAHAWRASIAEVALVHGTWPFVWITMLPGPSAGYAAGSVSLVPLQDLATMSTFQVVGNLFVLAALGFLAPVRYAAVAWFPRVLALAAIASILIEGAQHFLRLDRVTSVDDVLLNTAGAGLAALLSRPWWARGYASARLTRGASPVASRSSSPPRSNASDRVRAV